MDVQLVVKRGRTSANFLTIKRFPVLIGRHRECHLRIAARQVSRRHCVLKDRAGWLVVGDLDSCNGTLVNGRPVRGEAVLRPHDILDIGPVSFEIEYTCPVGEPILPHASDTLLMAELTAEIPSSLVKDAYELSECISDLDRRRPLDTLDTHRPNETISPSDSGSKIIVLDEEMGGSGTSPTRRIFASELLEESETVHRRL